MRSTLDQVIEIVAWHSGVPANKLNAQSAIDQDVSIGGDDIAELAEALAKEFGEQLWQWPWQRFAELNEGTNPFAILWLIWRLVTWPVRGRILDPSPFERLELGHIAAVIDRGEWFEP